VPIKLKGQSAYKCNTLNILKKYIVGCEMNKDKDKGYDSTRGGDKGVKSFYYILFTHLGFRWKEWLHELLGGRPCGSLLHVII